MAETYTVAFERLAENDLLEIENYIIGVGEPIRAIEFTGRIIQFCRGLQSFPFRGRDRSDLTPGLRTIGFERNTVVTYTIDEAKCLVVITGVFYGGQDWERHVMVGNVPGVTAEQCAVAATTGDQGFLETEIADCRSDSVGGIT